MCCRSSRTRAERAFDREIAELVERSQGTVHDIRVLSTPASGDEGSYDAAGRIDMDLLKAHLPFGDYDFYLCGPLPFMQAQRAALLASGVPSERIHREVFGPDLLDDIL